MPCLIYNTVVLSNIYLIGDNRQNKIKNNISINENIYKRCKQHL